MGARRGTSALLSILILLLGFARGASAQSTAEIVIEWNRILQTSLLVPGALPPTIFFTRPYAVLQVAVFDALNSIDYRYREQIVRAAVHGEATREVAAAQAAHDVMVNMFPPQAATFDAALAATTSRFSGPAAAEGARVGAAVARAVIEARANDGWNRPNPGYQSCPTSPATGSRCRPPTPPRPSCTIRTSRRSLSPAGCSSCPKPRPH